ncbi:MAG TPA: ABC transporter permease subunit [Phycisphaerae bacterium]|nr:ABC transporter permease subunit [Phycisphaerae bacterium]
MTRNVLALTQRELMSTFFSPVAYIVAAIFLLATGYLFMTQTLIEGAEATTRMLLDSMAWVLVFAIPLLTMRALAEEFSSGTIEALMTAPVTDVEVVLGKFFGVLVFYVALVFTTLVYVALLLNFGGGDVRAIAYGYFGLLLLGSLYVAVGVFASSLTKHQLLAALLGMGFLSVFTLLVDAFAGWKGGTWRTVLSYINIFYHFQDFSKGIMDTKSILFFLSGTVFFLFVAVKTLESRRWR